MVAHRSAPQDSRHPARGRSRTVDGERPSSTFPTRSHLMSLSTLRELLIDEVKDLYSAETQMIKALPKLAIAASSPALTRALTDHLAHTLHHVVRLERACEQLDCKP